MNGVVWRPSGFTKETAVEKHSSTGVGQRVKGNGKPHERGKPRGRKALSPNGVDKELKREGRRRKRRRKASVRAWTVTAKRASELVAKVRTAAQRYRRGQGEVGKEVRRRRRCVRCYQRLCSKHTEADAAQRTASTFAISCATVRRYARLYRDGGISALTPQPRGPRGSLRRVAVELEMLIVTLRVLYGWNERRMEQEVRQRGLGEVSHTTIGHIFHRHFLPVRCYHGKARSEGLTYRRYQKRAPNEQWHMDFAQVALEDGTNVLIAVLLDDATRYCIACQVIPNLQSETALGLIHLACRQLQVRPCELVTDNGTTFVSVYADVKIAFTQALDALHIRHYHTTPYYPEGNGKVEAFIKTMKRECRPPHLVGTPFRDVAEVQHTLDAFVTYYNFYRLHAALDYTPPAARYWGCPAPTAHGLCGLDRLPESVVSDYMNPDYLQVNTNPAVRRAALALAPLTF